MTKPSKARVKIANVAVIAVGAMLLSPLNLLPDAHSGVAYAQSYGQTGNRQPPPPRARRPAPTLSISVNRRLEEVQTLLDEKNYAEAEKELNDLANRRINDYEMAMVNYFRGLVHYEREDFAAAIRAYEAVLRSDRLPWSFYDSVKFTIAQLYFAEEKYEKSLQLINEWLVHQEDPPVQAYMFIGQGLYALERYREALEPIYVAMDMKRAAGQPISENTYLLLRSIYFELNDLEKVKEVLEILILNFPPKAEYWIQLSAIYGELKEEKKQLAAMEAAYMQGFLAKELHYVNLAQLYLYHQVPIKAVDVMKEGISKDIVEQDERNLETYAQALMAAKEFKRALDPLEKAAKLSEDGELFIRLAQVNIELDRHKDAIPAIQAALRKGDLDRPDQARILLCMSYYNVDQLEKALDACRDAAKDKRSRKTANQWINFLRKEIDRRRQLANALRPARSSISP